ncbi:MAG: AtpZ/AtpI family protein [Pseudomonadota bacterium]
MKNNGRLPSLDKLQAKIDKIKKPEQVASDISSSADMSQAVRLIIDLASGVLVGVGFGYLIDDWLDTSPWCVITGLFIGVAAGVRNMMRSAELIDKKMNEQQEDNEKI